MILLITRRLVNIHSGIKFYRFDDAGTSACLTTSGVVDPYD